MQQGWRLMCSSFKKDQRSKSFSLGQRAKSPHCSVGFCCISWGDAVWAAVLVSHQQEMKERWRQHTQSRLSHKLIGFPRRGGTNWDPELNPFLLGQSLLCSHGKECVSQVRLPVLSDWRCCTGQVPEGLPDQRLHLFVPTRFRSPWHGL